MYSAFLNVYMEHILRNWNVNVISKYGTHSRQQIQIK